MGTFSLPFGICGKYFGNLSLVESLHTVLSEKCKTLDLKLFSRTNIDQCFGGRPVRHCEFSKCDNVLEIRFGLDIAGTNQNRLLMSLSLDHHVVFNLWYFWQTVIWNILAFLHNILLHLLRIKSSLVFKMWVRRKMFVESWEIREEKYCEFQVWYLVIFLSCGVCSVYFKDYWD